MHLPGYYGSRVSTWLYKSLYKIVLTKMILSFICHLKFYGVITYNTNLRLIMLKMLHKI